MEEFLSHFGLVNKLAYAEINSNTKEINLSRLSKYEKKQYEKFLKSIPYSFIAKNIGLFNKISTADCSSLFESFNINQSLLINNNEKYVNRNTKEDNLSVSSGNESNIKPIDRGKFKYTCFKNVQI